MSEMDFDIVKIIAIALSFIVAIVGHEIMHGYTAYKLGDNTAKNAGRLSINPIKHIDPIGSILFPGLLFILSHGSFTLGWAKPVPININTVMRNGGENGAIKVALAGITFNFLLIALFSFIYLFFDFAVLKSSLLNSTIIEKFFYIFIANSIIINALLGFFNLLPIPPLDGSQALKYFAMKHRWYKLIDWINKLTPYGLFILMVIIATPIANYLFMPIFLLISIILH